MSGYTRISLEEREKIYLLQKQNFNITAIARVLGRNKSNISRELKRCFDDPLGYMPDRTHALYKAGLSRNKALAEGCQDGVLVFEDDIIINDLETFSEQLEAFIDNLPNNFDVGFLGYNQVSGHRITIPENNKVSAISPDFIAWGMYAAIYSRAGMEKLLNNFEQYKNQIDIFMFEQNSYLDPTKLNVYVSEIDMIDAGMHASTISEMGRDEGTSYYY